jgi:predicted AlkP superfamily phosphohydrolase/phosphomutase
MMHTLILGFDSCDPGIFERLASQGKLPNLARYAEAGKYARFTVSDPPQTEVSWTSIATGLDPGGHGIFDFVHRDPVSYTPFVSLLPTQRSALGLQFVPPVKARTIFEEATRMGYPATSLWWPATFPARPEIPVRTIPGLGTPDLLGRLGVGALYTNDPARANVKQKTPVKILKSAGKDRYSSVVEGPAIKKGEGAQSSLADLRLDLDGEHNAVLSIGSQAIPLKEGEWSPIFEVSFKMGLLMTVRALTRAILTHIVPEVRLYLLPLQIHPLASTWRYATPPSFVKGVWKACGPYLSLGWPQDTTGLEEGCIIDDQFLSLCDSIFATRECTLMHLLESFDEGLLAAVFDSLDRVQHMFWRDRLDIVEGWYGRLDSLVGRVEQRLAQKGKPGARLLVLSDHGFSAFSYKVHLNRWLAENGFLVARGTNGAGSLEEVEWSQTQAYAVGLNSCYLNLANREGQGSVAPDQAQDLAGRLRENLASWQGLDGRPVVQRVLLRDEAFSGPLSVYGPDLLLGYSPGYRASAETGLGKWNETCLEPNQDHWGADHCIDSQAVPGVFFASQGLGGISNPSYRDIPRFAIGKELEQPAIKSPPQPPSSGEEGKEILEERLKSLGYL